jgi:formylglycine-generating enzyme required for sulfatase activity
MKHGVVMKLQDLLNLLALLASVALAACATGRTPPATTTMASLPDDGTLTYLFGVGDKACTITTTSGLATQNLGSPEVLVKVKPFAIDVHEVTNEQYRYCIDMGVCSDVAGYDGPNLIADYFVLSSSTSGDANPKYAAYPVVYVTQQQAKEYCSFVGKRLPTEFEWERVASGPGKTREEKQLYTFLPDKGPDVKIPTGCDKRVALSACTNGTPEVRAVATMQDDVVMIGGIGVYDLAGNVMEWTASDSDEEKANANAKPISATCDWSGDEKWTCDECLACLAKPTVPCTMCNTCMCGNSIELPADPTAKDATTLRAECYQPNKTPICPRYPANTVLDKPYTGKNSSSRRIIRGGASVSSSQNPYGVTKANVENCFGRSDARVMAKGSVDPPLAIVGFRCAKDL